MNEKEQSEQDRKNREEVNKSDREFTKTLKYECVPIGVDQRNTVIVIYS